MLDNVYKRSYLRGVGGKEMETSGGFGFSNCQYGFGQGNAGGFGAAGYGGLLTFTSPPEQTNKTALECAPEQELELQLQEAF